MLLGGGHSSASSAHARVQRQRLDVLVRVTGRVDDVPQTLLLDMPASARELLREARVPRAVLPDHPWSMADRVRWHLLTGSEGADAALGRRVMTCRMVDFACESIK